MPGMHGNAVDACPFVWCRVCGAIWLPRQEGFTRAFERHSLSVAVAPMNGGIEGYWIVPGLNNVISLPPGSVV